MNGEVLLLLQLSLAGLEEEEVVEAKRERWKPS